jgi:sugar lactone lactonase YvrE
MWNLCAGWIALWVESLRHGNVARVRSSIAHKRPGCVDRDRRSATLCLFLFKKVTALMKIDLVVDGQFGTGESPVWDDRRQCLWWTDIPAKVIFRMDWGDRKVTRFDMPRRVGSLGLCESNRLILGFEDGVFLHEPGTSHYEHIATIEADRVMNRLNDGKVGPDGAFWVGSMDERTPRQPSGALYRVTRAGAQQQFDGVTVSNGLAWTPDGKTMLHADTAALTIHAWNFDAGTGAISNRRLLATADEAAGRPDGGACDRDGHYWSAGVSAGCLNCYDMKGHLVRKVMLPVPHPTMPCFAGPDLRTVFVTSLRVLGNKTDLEKWPHSGGLYQLDLGVAGVPVHRFRDV